MSAILMDMTTLDSVGRVYIVNVGGLPPLFRKYTTALALTAAAISVACIQQPHPYI